MLLPVLVCESYNKYLKNGDSVYFKGYNDNL